MDLEKHQGDVESRELGSYFAEFKVDAYSFYIQETQGGHVRVGFYAGYVDLGDPRFFVELSKACEIARVLDAVFGREVEVMVADDVDHNRDYLLTRLHDDAQYREAVLWDEIRAEQHDLVKVPERAAWLFEQAREIDALCVPKVERIIQPAHDGYVYVLKSETGHWKIGRAKHPEDRLKTFGVKLPFRVDYELVIPSRDYVALEAELHQRFDYCRLDGEWFDLTDGDIDDLRREFDDVASEYNQ